MVSLLYQNLKDYIFSLKSRQKILEVHSKNVLV